MTKLQRSFLTLLSDFAEGRTNGICPEPEQIPALMNLAIKHAVSGIAAFQIYRTLKKSGNAVTEQCMRIYQLQLLRGTQLDQGILKLKRAFDQRNISIAFVKGAAVRRLYPVPELREMGDIDTLIRKEDRSKADVLLRELGFSRVTGAGDEWTYTNKQITLELHTNLYPDRSWNEIDYNAYFANAFDDTAEDARCGIRTLHPEQHFVFLVQHLAKHFVGSGAGVRLIFDFDVFLRVYGAEMDYEKIRSELQKLLLLDFAENVLLLCGNWFGTAIPKPLLNPKAVVAVDEAYRESLTEEILSAGQFGCFSDNDGLKRIRKGYRYREKNTAGTWFRALLVNLFPDYRFMRRYMKALDGRPYLLPAAWVKRWWIAVFRRRKDTKEAMRVFSTKQSAALRQHQMLKRLGL